jgi:hypothetical protein
MPRLRPSGYANCGRHDLQATKLPLTTLFLAFYLIGQVKTGNSSLELSRHLGVYCDRAWLLQNKILSVRAKADPKASFDCFHAHQVGLAIRE